MANFNTHLIVASSASGLAGTAFYGAGIATPKEMLIYFSMGTLGGLLPDIDSDNSVVSRIISSTILIYLTAATLFLFVPSPRPFFYAVMNKNLLTRFKANLLPREHWFFDPRRWQQ